MSPCPYTNIFQSCMVFIFQEMECHWWKDFDEQLVVLDKKIMIMENHGMEVNLTKSEICSFQVEFMGFLLKKMVMSPLKRE